MAVLAAPLALVVLSLPEVGPARLVQTVWTGTLLGGTALLASYPWLRPEPLLAALSWFGLAPRLLPALGCAAAFLALTAVGRRLRPGWVGPLTGAALVAAAVVHLPSPGEALIPVEMPVVLDAARPAWEAQVGGAPARGLTVESSLANSGSLPAGSAVVRVRLVTAGGETIERLLRAGEETGEWAARRPDLAHPAKPLAPSPPAWISWVAGDFFAQRYRCRFDLNGTERIASLSVQRLADLPADVTIALHGAELKR
jgi:hypothetical protein